MGDRAARIAREWRRLTQTSNSFFIEALNAIRPEVPAWRAIVMANVESAGGLDDAQEAMFREGLAEVFSTPAPAQILFDGFGFEQRPPLARMLARRVGRVGVTFDDYVDADTQITVIDQWARRSHAANFRRRSPDILRDVAAELEWHMERSAYVPSRPITYRELSQIAGQTSVTGVLRGKQVRTYADLLYVEGSSPVETVAEFRVRRRQFIGNRIRARRKELDISQDQLARRLGIERTDLSDWERGKHEPSEANLARLEDALEVERGYLTATCDEENAA